MSNDDWHPHDGGPRQVAPETRVVVMFRGYAGSAGGTNGRADELLWPHEGRSYDIIAYLVIGP